jgi:hypothetical protein
MIFAVCCLAYADDNKSTTLSWSGPSASYTWTVPSSVDLTPGNVANGTVSITKFIGASGTTLTIKLTSSTNGFKVKNGSSTVSYTASFNSNGTSSPLAANATIKSVSAGTSLASPASQVIYFKLGSYNDTDALVTGSYSDTITFTASIA